MKNNSSFIFFIFFIGIHAQFLASYISEIYYFNLYFTSILLLLFSFLKVRKQTVIFIFLVVVFLFYFLYRYKSSYDEYFSISVKSIQFNFGYLILIPCLLSLRKRFDFRGFIKLCFYIFCFEICIEYLVIKFYNVDILKHVSIAYLYYKGELISLVRAFGISGNSSVSGVQLTVLFLLNISSKKETDFKSILKSFDFLIFILSFLAVFSGTAFFSIFIAFGIYYFMNTKILNKFIFISCLILVVVYLFYTVDFSVTSANKFSIGYLFYLLFDSENPASLIPTALAMADTYGLEKLIFGNYIIPWGSDIEGVFFTVDYTYINLIFEFGVIGLMAYLYIVYFVYKTIVSKLGKDKNREFFYFKIIFLILIISTFHYPVISYYYTQILVSIVFISFYNSDEKELNQDKL